MRIKVCFINTCYIQYVDYVAQLRLVFEFSYFYYIFTKNNILECLLLSKSRVTSYFILSKRLTMDRK